MRHSATIASASAPGSDRPAAPAAPAAPVRPQHSSHQLRLKVARGLCQVRQYGQNKLRGDLAAGLTTGILLVPQGMGYALLAGLPPVAGLYASLLPLVTYAALGTSRHLAVGPVAVDSLLVAVTVGAVAQSGTADYLSTAALLGALVGALQLLMGTLRFGFLINFLSRPVLSGFTSAVALIIAGNQLQHLLLLNLPRGHQLHHILWAAAARWDQWHWPTVGVGVSGGALLVLLKKVAPRLPRAMFVVSTATMLVAFGPLAGIGLATVGQVPAGLPALQLPYASLELATELAPAALTIALLSYVEGISVATRLARHHGYAVQANREALALGAANLGGSLTGGFPIAGGFSRSAVNSEAGAKTRVAGLFTALVVAATLLLLTPLFTPLPKAILAALIIAAVAGLVDLKEPGRLWHVKRSDFWLLLLTATATLGLGIQQGLALGIGASLALLLYRTTQPHIAILGQVPAQARYVNIARHPEALTIPEVLMLRIDAQFYFGNVSYLKSSISKLLAEHPQTQTVIVDASGINQLDSTAEEGLRELRNSLKAKGVDLVLTALKGPVRDVLVSSGLLQQLEEDNCIHPSNHSAMVALHQGSPTRHRRPQSRYPSATEQETRS